MHLHLRRYPKVLSTTIAGASIRKLRSTLKGEKGNMRLKLKWARFFTLAGWNWTLASQSAGFDLIVTIPCSHSECDGSHVLAVTICEMPLDALVEKCRALYDAQSAYQSPHPAIFGPGPQNTRWEMAHGAGGGTESVSQWLGESKANGLWERAERD